MDSSPTRNIMGSHRILILSTIFLHNLHVRRANESKPCVQKPLLCVSASYMIPISYEVGVVSGERDRKGKAKLEEEMEEGELDYVLVPLCLMVLGIYHLWLLYTIIRHPSRTVIGLNAQSRYQWVLSMMADPLKNGVLAVQTIRNNIMASTLLATTAITLSSLIGIFANSDKSETKLVYGNKTPLNSAIKRLSISLCFLVAFLCNVQSIRYYAHVSFLITSPALKGKKDFIEYVAKTLNRGSLSWSLGLRAFYLSFPLVLWIYGPIPMFACCCLTSFILYFLDTTTQIIRDLHTKSFKERETEDMETA